MSDVGKIKKRAMELGFVAFGIGNVEPQEVSDFEQWLNEEKHGEMAYLKRHLDIRKNPQNLLLNAKSIISVAHPCMIDTADELNPFLSFYARGKDYHIVVKEKLEELAKYISSLYEKVNYRTFVDTCPLSERQIAQNAGLGAKGKNGLVYVEGYGSFIHFGEIVLDIELEQSTPCELDICGDCSLCIDNCPTGALCGDGENVNAVKCYSYLSIESKHIEDLAGSEYIFGCDICQSCCPHNSYKKVVQDEKVLREILDMSEEDFNSRFADSPIKRAGYKKIVGQIKRKTG